MKKRFVALMMMVAMTATLVACSGKDAPKENTTAGTNDSAVEATTGTTTQDVAESNEETTTPDVSEVEEEQVGETNKSNTSTGTLGGESSDANPEIVDYNSDKYDQDAGIQLIASAPIIDGTLPNDAFVAIINHKNSNSADFVFRYRPESLGKTFGVSLVAPIESRDRNYSLQLSDTVMHLENYSNGDYHQIFQTKIQETLGDLSSNEAWQAQLDREWPSIKEEYSNIEGAGGDFVETVLKNDTFIKVVREARINNYRGGGYDIVGYIVNFIDRRTGFNIQTEYFTDAEHYDDNVAYSVARSVALSDNPTFEDCPSCNF